MTHDTHHEFESLHGPSPADRAPAALLLVAYAAAAEWLDSR